MRKIIDGKKYDTRTATEVCDVSQDGYNQGDWHYDDTRLYRTPKGNWFLAGRGGPLSRWGRPYGQNGHIGGSAIRPLDKTEARELLEQYGDADAVEDCFGAEIEDA